eukprot:s128_g4.t1
MAQPKCMYGDLVKMAATQARKVLCEAGMLPLRADLICCWQFGSRMQSASSSSTGDGKDGPQCPDCVFRGRHRLQLRHAPLPWSVVWTGAMRGYGPSLLRFLEVLLLRVTSISTLRKARHRRLFWLIGFDELSDCHVGWCLHTAHGVGALLRTAMLFEDGRGGLPWLALRDGFRILKANLQMPCGQALLSVSFASSAALEDRTALGYTAQPWLGRPGPTLSGFCPCCRDADTRSETCLSAENDTQPDETDDDADVGSAGALWRLLHFGQ